MTVQLELPRPVPVADRTIDQPPALRRFRIRDAPWPRRARVALPALAIAGLIVVVVCTDSDTGRDSGQLARSLGSQATQLRWQFAAVVVVLAGAHYVAAAVAVRAAAGIRVGLTEVVAVQLTAAAANRLTPAGVGGSAVTTRFLSRRGLPASEALGSVAALSVLGPVADLIVPLLLVLIGGLLGLGGASAEIGSLATRLDGVARAATSPWVWLGVGALVAAIVAVCLFRGRTDCRARLGQFFSPARTLVRRPVALATLMVASGLTTLILGFAFVACVAMVPGPRPTIAVGALLASFMVGAAAGTSVPIPAGVGTTEAALVAVLMSAHLVADSAISVVMAFRIITFWLPALIGVLVLRRLHRRGAI